MGTIKRDKYWTERRKNAFVPRLRMIRLSATKGFIPFFYTFYKLNFPLDARRLQRLISNPTPISNIYTFLKQLDKMGAVLVEFDGRTTYFYPNRKSKELEELYKIIEKKLQNRKKRTVAN